MKPLSNHVFCLDCRNVDLSHEDDAGIRDYVTTNLSDMGFDVATATTVPIVEEVESSQEPSVFFVDVALAGTQESSPGLGCRESVTSPHLRVVMLTSSNGRRGQSADREVTSDAHLGESLSPQDLLQTVGHLLCSADPTGMDQGCLEIDNFRLNYRRQRFHLGENEVDLTSTEFRILAILMENVGIPIMRKTLLKEVWGYSEDIRTRTLDTHMKRLRGKLGDDCNRITTLRGQGYTFS